MKQYILRRVLLMVPTLVVMSVLIVLVVRLLPGSVVDQMLGEYQVSAAEKEAFLDKLGVNKPLYQQYWDWVRDAVRGDFGESLRTRNSISSELKERFPRTIEIGFLALAVAMAIALPVGIISAIKQDSWIDYAARSFAIFALSVPSFWIAALVVTYGAIWFQWAPPLTYQEFWESPGENIKIVWAPAIILGMGLTGTTMRLTRTQMLEVLRQDYIRTAWAKGLPGRTVVFRHALKNAMIPVITIIGLLVPLVVGGAVVVEFVFNIPGMGRYMLEAIQTRDYPVVQAINMVVTVVVMLSNLAVDLSYGFLDPRIRYG